jgi:septum formation protein
MLILASQSPRRQRLLLAAGVTFEVRPVDIDERPRSGESAATYVERMADDKAAAALKRFDLREDDWVLAADTTVVLDDEVIGKPLDREDAVRMIGHLAGRTHQVFTAVCLIAADGRRLRTMVRTSVSFRPAGKSEIERYVALGESDDKAGGYAVQGKGAMLIDRIDGSFTNVIGLPLPETLVLLKECGVIG